MSSLSLKEIINSFNDILSGFLAQITPLIGSSYSSKFDMIVKINNSMPIEQFMAHAIPHRDQILTRNEDYFKNSENIDEKLRDNNVVMGEILRLQSIWTQIDESSRDNVWDIFQSMLYLGEEYIKSKY